MSDKLRRLKEEMIEIYGNYCWMNELWIPNKRNIITFHHIIERRNGGKDIWENGALLSNKSHQYLNFIDSNYHKIYKELNGMFYDLNRTYEPPTEEYYKEIKRILRRI